MALLIPIPCYLTRGFSEVDLSGNVPRTSRLSSALRKGNGDNARPSQGTDTEGYLVFGELKYQVRQTKVSFCDYYTVPVVNYLSYFPPSSICHCWRCSWCLIHLLSSFFLLSLFFSLLSGWQISFKPLANSNG